MVDLVLEALELHEKLGLGVWSGDTKCEDVTNRKASVRNRIQRET